MGGAVSDTADAACEAMEELQASSQDAIRAICEFVRLCSEQKLWVLISLIVSIRLTNVIPYFPGDFAHQELLVDLRSDCKTFESGLLRACNYMLNV